MMAFFSAVEPLRIANRISGRPLFDWTLFGLDGQPVTASNGMTLMVDQPAGDVHALPSLAVCSGFAPEAHLSRPLMAWLHRLDQAGCALGGLDTGCFLLAAAGDRKSTRLNSSHVRISYAVFCLKKKKTISKSGTATCSEIAEAVPSATCQRASPFVSRFQAGRGQDACSCSHNAG